MADACPYVEPADSCATIMRGVAAALRDEWMVPETWPAILVALTRPANHLPLGLRLRLVRFFVRNVGVDPQVAAQVTSSGLAQWAVDLYEAGTVPPYDAIILGAPSGGVGHLAALLGAPFLGDRFVTRYRYRGHADDVAAYQDFGARLAETVLARNDDLTIVNHYDPIHDRFMVPYVSYIRMKLLSLPAPYAEFIGRHLRPGGTLLYADCRYAWGQYRVNRRLHFQVGGLGGVPDAEYVTGSPEISRFLAAQGESDQRAWSLPYPWLRQPESEWGSLPSFRQAVESFAGEHGYRFMALNGAHPEDFSRLAFYASYQAWLDGGSEPSGILVDCFDQTSPTAALRAGLLPLWLPFNCTDSLDFLRKMSSDFPRGKPVLLAPVPSYSPSWDVGSAAGWQTACGSDTQVTWIGANPKAYPADLASLFRYVPDLQAWCARNPQRKRPKFAVEDLQALIQRMATAPGNEAANAGDAPPQRGRQAALKEER